ncbi:MAG: hypothetical protein D6798_10420, partial [Deltaproteobacteria bacterium]
SEPLAFFGPAYGVDGLPGPSPWRIAGLSLDRLAGIATPPRSLARARTALLLAAPLLIAGLVSLARTDAIVERIPSPMFSRTGQESVAAMLDAAGTTHLVVSDYETCGVLEQLRPHIEVIHAWPLTARRGPRVLPELLRFIAGRPDTDFLVVEASQPMGYNLRPTASRLRKAAETAGVRVERIAALDDDRAVLYRVRAAGPISE